MNTGDGGLAETLYVINNVHFFSSPQPLHMGKAEKVNSDLHSINTVAEKNILWFFKNISVKILGWVEQFTNKSKLTSLERSQRISL